MAEKHQNVDHDKCIRCCRCVAICPKEHLELSEGNISEVEDPIHACIGCCHCMAVCPTEAIRIEGNDYSDFEKLPDRLPGLDDILPLLKARRSVRKYQKKPVPRDVIERIIDVATLAPMGLPPHRVEILVFDERRKIAEFIPSALVELKKWVEGFRYPFSKLVMRFMMSGEVLKVMEEQVVPLAKGIIWGEEHSRDFLTYGAPAMLIFHSTKFEEAYEENAVIAKVYAMLAAEGLGLGSCISGMIPPVFEHNKVIREKYGIPKDNKVCGCLLLGYPVPTYNRAIPRKFEDVRWV